MRINKKYYYLLIIIMMIAICSCTSDYTKDLGNGYFYRHEGYPLNDILCEKVGGGQIPATVVDYAYNDKFIIAKQKPRIPQDSMYDKTYEYKNGANVFYYWLIVKEEHIVLGPLDIDSFEKERVKYKIPKELRLK